MSDTCEHGRVAEHSMYGIEGGCPGGSKVGQGIRDDTVTLYQRVGMPPTIVYNWVGEFRRVRWCTVHDSQDSPAGVVCQCVIMAKGSYDPCEFSDKLIEA